MTSPTRDERTLAALLRVAGAILLAACGAVVMPGDWMAATHRRLGLGAFPSSPLVDYLTRSISALYAIKGGLYLVLSRDVARHAPVIVYCGWSTVAFGVTVLVIDLHAGLPWPWIAGEGPPIALLGALVLVLARRAGRGAPAG